MTATEELLAKAAQEFSEALGGMKAENLIPWNEIPKGDKTEETGIEPIETLDGKAFAALSHDQRRAVIDKVWDIGLHSVYEGHSEAERNAAHLAIDKGVRTAKWGYILALVNDAYDLGYDRLALQMLAPLCTQLSTVERGATNAYMPTTHKLRHNPAVHSIHVMGLVAEVFDGLIAMHPQHADGLKEMRQQLLHSAVVHDMGELRGELSVAIDRKNLSAEAVERIEQSRGGSEAEVFEAALGICESRFSQGFSPESAAAQTEALLHDYHVAEDTDDKFMGRLFKLMERMQSQEDYLRFEGRDMAPKLSVRTLQSAGYQQFMMDYALSPRNGTTRGIKTKASLDELTTQYENPELAALVLDTVDARLDVLQREIEKATALSIDETTQAGKHVADCMRMRDRAAAAGIGLPR